MKPKKSKYNPFVRKNDSIRKVMLDVAIALVPVVLITIPAYGFAPLLVILVSVVTALITELLMSLLLFRRYESIGDGSALVTGILLALTIGPFTPLYIVVFGSASAILFGKMLWGGVGRNTFNPALMGREFMTIFFPVIMVSEQIYFQPELIQQQEIYWFDNHFINQLFYQASGANGEYSVFLLALGGIYLLFRRRISWHIPVGVMGAFTLMLLFLADRSPVFSLGGVFLGAIYMATDMPTSSSTPAGKSYFGAMIGIICVLCLTYDIPRGYLSYAILLMNLFVVPIDRIFKPIVWGHKKDLLPRLGKILFLTAGIILSSFVVIRLHHMDAIKYLIGIFILYTLVRFVINRRKGSFDPYPAGVE